MSHCESVDSSILDTTVESWERHFVVNARVVWLLVKAFAERLRAETTTEARGRIVALTSEHATHNLPCGASKGALDRVVVAAAVELASRDIRANVINPGPIDTGWMTPQIREALLAQTPAGWLGTPADPADLVRFNRKTHRPSLDSPVTGALRLGPAARAVGRAEMCTLLPSAIMIWPVLSWQIQNRARTAHRSSHPPIGQHQNIRSCCSPSVPNADLAWLIVRCGAVQSGVRDPVILDASYVTCAGGARLRFGLPPLLCSIGAPSDTEDAQVAA